MSDLYPLHGEYILLFKTSISFIDHLQQFYSAVLIACTLVEPPVIELKRNLFGIIEVLQLVDECRKHTRKLVEKNIIAALNILKSRTRAALLD
ncbi:hypothetical protein LWI29_019345 [Acer saccharum]|uniref:Uncharacterized protein n=1 Tax=Acer saccharum TaxID=4024 RepID=A0AA39SWA5_ACESA|nr:hypothetical protein LWI29_019345 [Acer saccharum]